MEYDIIIIGAGISGMTAAIYSARAAKSVLVIEENVPGGQILSVSGVGNWPGETKISGRDLSEKIYHQMNNLSVKMVYDKVEGLFTDKKATARFTVRCEDSIYEGKTVIIATGSEPRPLGVPHEAEFVNHGLSYCVACDAPLFKGQDVAVVGGGNTALYSALHLAGIAKKVYLIHRRDGFRADETLVEKARSLENVEFITGVTVTKILGEDHVEGLELSPSDPHAVSQKLSPDQRHLEVSGVFVAIGRDPATGIFKDVVDLDASGYIKTSRECETSVEGAFAAGDCRAKSVRQLVTAAGDGAIAASSAIQLLNKAP